MCRVCGFFPEISAGKSDFDGSASGGFGIVVGFLTPITKPHKTVVEHLLMMSGVEPNPRLIEKVQYAYRTQDASRFLWPTIGGVEKMLVGQIKRLLKYFDP